MLWGKKRLIEGEGSGFMDAHAVFRKSLSVQTVLDIPYFDGTLADAVLLSLPFLRERTPLAVFTPGATVAARAAKDSTFSSILKKGILFCPMEKDACLPHGFRASA